MHPEFPSRPENRLRGSALRRGGGPATAALPAVAAFVTILVLDAVASSRQWPVVLQGLLDEPAHLLTAWLLLTALMPSRWRRLTPWALIGSMAIDIDHIPMYLWGVGTAGDGRPVTHSLAFVLVLVAVGVLVPRLRIAASGLGVGLLLHLVRDLATGPGVPLLWPVHDSSLLVPHAGYLAALGLATVAAALRRTASVSRR